MKSSFAVGSVLMATLLLITFTTALDRIEGLAPTPTPAPVMSVADFVPAFAPQPCWEKPPAALEVTCGTLLVPEDRDRALSEDNLVRLALAILHAPAATPDPDPLFILVGGPGQNAVHGFLTSWEQYFALRANGFPPEQYEGHHAMLTAFLAAWDVYWQLLQQHDMVLIDQRGTGYTRPSLDCAGDSPPDCRRRLIESGVELSAYTTRENAADINDVRRALGYAEINLYGGSYGTLLGLALLRDYGHTVRAAVFESLLPPSVSLYMENISGYAAVFGRVFAACAADPACAEAYPDLEGTFYRAITTLNQSPARVEIGRPGSPGYAVEWLTGDGLANFIWNLLYEGTLVPYLPKLISDAAAGTLDLVEAIATLRAADESDGLHWGMTWSVECAEQIAFLDEDAVWEAVFTLPEALQDSALLLLAQEVDHCRVWQVPPVDRADLQPVSSDVPVLLLSGEFDPVTPPAFGAIAAETLTNGHHVVLRGHGHTDSFLSPCAMTLMAAFYDNPHAPLDLTCVQALPAPAFVLPAAAAP